MPEPPTSTSPGENEGAGGKRGREAAAQDLAATIEKLADIADRGLGEGSIAGWNAARAALAAAGRLQMGRRAGRTGPAIEAVDDDLLDDEAWPARFGPGSAES